MADKKDEKISTLEKVFLIIECVVFAFAIAFATYIFFDSRKDLRRMEERTEERRKERELPKIKESEIPEIKKQYQEMCDFYLDTTTATDVALDNETLSKEYLLETFEKYLKLDKLVPKEVESWKDDEFLSDFIFDRVEEKKAIKIKAELIRRWKLIIEIQEILKEKLEEVQLESQDYLSHFVDGRFGEKTKELTIAILKSTPAGYNWYGHSLFFMDLEGIFESDKSELSSFFKFLKQGKLKVITIELPESTRDYINILQKEIKKYEVTQENHQHKEDEIIKQKIERAMNFINKQKKEILKSARSEKEKIEKGRALMLVAVNYLIKSWEGSPTSTHEGWARYPYDKKGKSDKNYRTIDCSTYIKRIIETLFPELNRQYSHIAQKRPWQQPELYAKFLGISATEEEKEKTDKFNKIFMIDGREAGHMRLIFADLDSDTDFAIIKISEASGGSVKNRLIIKEKDEEEKKEYVLWGTVNVSSTQVVKKWLLNN